MRRLLWSENRSEGVYSFGNGHAFFVFLLVGSVISLPGLKGFFYWDDFFLMCMARYIGNPIDFFIQDYYPGRFYYRPLGMVSWWLIYQLFGLDPILHNLLNPLLLVINAFSFYLLLDQLFDKKRWMALLTSLLFLVHPVTISRSISQADRFDLMATAFILLTLYLFFRFLSTQRRVYLISSLSAAFLGILSKEISFCVCLLITLIVFTFPDLTVKREWFKKVFLLLPYYLISIFLLVIRFLMSRGVHGVFFEDGLIRSFWNGFLKWIHFMPDMYLSHVDVLGAGDFVKWTFVLLVLLLAAVIVLSIKSQRSILWHLFLFGFAVIGISGYIMAPVMNLSTLVKPGGGFSFFLVVQGRFYYLPLVGFLIILDASLVLISSFLSARRRVQLYFILLLPFFIVAFSSYALSSWALGRGWKELTNGRERQLVELAGRAVEEAPSIVPGTKVYLLNTERHSHFREFGDTMLKSIAPENSKVIHCLVFTEKPPWYNFVLKEDVGKMEMKPMRKMRVRGGEEFPPSGAGDYVHFYFTFPGGDEIVKDPKAVFFEFLTEEGRFVDVTESVRIGRRKVQFFNDRPGS